MRKSNREIADVKQIIDLIKNTTAIRLGINDNLFPYVVPVSFGFEIIDNKIVFYFHGATEGKKVNLIENNPFVCVEGDIFHRYFETSKSITCLYESFIGYGRCERLQGDSAKHGLNEIIKHCGYTNTYNIDDKVLQVVNVYKIELQSITAKHRTKDN